MTKIIRSIVRKYRDWVGADKLERIRENARKALGEAGSHADPNPLLTRDAPAPLKKLPRNGEAYFVKFFDLGRRGFTWVEVDEESETVTRTWTTPR